MSQDRIYGVRELANWILAYADRRGFSITNMSLNKLVYFAYEHALVQHGRKLTSAKIEAWEHGPVFREIYRSFKGFGDRPITSRAKLYDPISDTVKMVDPNLSTEDEKIVEEAIGPIAHLRRPTSRK